MSIRINPNPAPDLLADIALDRQEQNTALQEISTGQSVNQLSDDPSAAAQVVLNHAQNSQNTQYLSTISSLQPEAQTIDSTLNSAVEAVTQAISLGTEGANSDLSDSDRQAIATQLQGIQSQVLSLANLQYQGNYVFSGTATSTQPFVLDSSQPDGVKYNGNTGVNSVEISPGERIQVNQPGSQIFTNSSGDLFGALSGLITALQNNSGIAAANTNLNTALNQLTTQQVFYGSNLQQLNAAQTNLNNSQVQVATQENSLVGVDLTTAITNLQQASTATSAILSATNQVLTTLNLLDYLT